LGRSSGRLGSSASNKQNYQNCSVAPTPCTVSLTVGKPSGVDKLNGYRHAGDTAILSKQSKWGILRTGAWYDWAYTDRYQFPSNPITWVDTPLSNFHEHFLTQSTQPFAEFEWHPIRKCVVITGVKDANYQMYLNQYQDGKTVGCLPGKPVAATNTVPANCPNGGAAFTTHGITYNNWLPNASARYYVKNNWSVYAQFGEGSIIPPSNVFDVTGGIVLMPPKPTVAKTYQTGTVMKFRRWTLDADYYYIHFQNGYDMYTDPTTLEPAFVATGPSNTQGFEAEGTVVIGWGLSAYANVMAGTAKYQTGPNYPNGGMWVQDAPSNLETLSLMWIHKNFDVGFIDKRVGQMYNDNGTLTYTINGIQVPYPVDQAITIAPFSVMNFFANYTIKNASWLRGSKLGLAINNLADNHSIVGVLPAVAATATVPYVQNQYDQINLLPGRSVMATLTVGWAPRR
jgi:iron complex outermembrane recepter protein